MQREALPLDPEDLLGRTQSFLGDGSAYDETLAARRERDGACRPARALPAGRTGRAEVGGDSGTSPEKLTLLCTHAPPSCFLRSRKGAAALPGPA